METINFQDALASADLRLLLQKAADIRVGVLGDLCLDVYWDADMTKSELSRETPHFPLPVVGERFSLGAAANVCANAASLGVKRVCAVGTIGDDWRGIILKQCCAQQGIDTSFLVGEAERFTNAYCKPIRHGISPVAYEDPRLDFSTDRPIGRETEAAILENLDGLDVDVLCVSDQMKQGCITEAIRDKVMQLSRAGLLVVVDSRDRIACYRDVILKPNEVEGYKAAHSALPPEGTGPEAYSRCAGLLAARANSRVFMTLGASGCLYTDGGAAIHMTAAKPPRQIDFVGAGDTVLAALGVALAAGAEPTLAMLFANLCASITIGKLGTTGTASPGEIMDAIARQTR